MNGFIEKSLEFASNIPYEDIDSDDVYGTYSILKLMKNKEIDEANEHLMCAASYMDNEIVSKSGRNRKGENDFAALRCIIALNTVYDKLKPEVIVRMKKFLLEEDIASEYGSENHVFVFRVCRFLAAEFFGEDFPYYKMTCKEVLEQDKKYILDFITFRAKYGVGEFTSAYLFPDMVFVGTLECYAKDELVKKAAKMALDMLTLEDLNNTDNSLNAMGALGRSYPHDIFPQHCATGSILKKIMYERFFTLDDYSSYLLSPFTVDKFILDIFENRQFPCEIKERKHLHSMSAWRPNMPDYKQIVKLLSAGSINKYTYICDGYGLGAVNHQDDYPVDETGDYEYAHHQQLEWALLFPENEKFEATRIYSHHPGTTGEHNSFTGDLRCCCSKSFANKDTSLSVYNIEKDGQLNYTVLFIDPTQYDKYEEDGHYVFAERNGYYCVTYIAKPFRHGEMTAGKIVASVLISDGRKNGYALHVEKADGSFEDFKCRMKQIPVNFDEEKVELTFGKIKIDRHHDYTNGTENEYPYDYVYDTPWCKSKWGEGIITVKAPDGEYVLDYNNFEVIKK